MVLSHEAQIQRQETYDIRPPRAPGGKGGRVRVSSIAPRSFAANIQYFLGFEALRRCSEGGYSRPTPMCRCASI